MIRDLSRRNPCTSYLQPHKDPLAIPGHTRTRMKNVKAKTPPIQEQDTQDHGPRRITGEMQASDVGRDGEERYRRRSEEGKRDVEKKPLTINQQCESIQVMRESPWRQTMPPTPATRIQVGCTEGDGVTCHVNPDIGGRGKRRTTKTGRSKR